jgi:hypothetical protein
LFRHHEASASLSPSCTCPLCTCGASGPITGPTLSTSPVRKGSCFSPQKL